MSVAPLAQASRNEDKVDSRTIACRFSMVKYQDAMHEELCKDSSVPPLIWIGLALQLFWRLGSITQQEFDAELSKLKLPPRARTNLIYGRHCMLSPLCDMASLIAVAQIQLVGQRAHSPALPAPFFNAECLFWALVSQLLVHSKEVLGDMARSWTEAYHNDELLFSTKVVEYTLTYHLFV